MTRNVQKKIHKARGGEKSRIQFWSEYLGKWTNVTTWPLDKKGALKTGFRLNW
jgi:hypothetical protein